MTFLAILLRLWGGQIICKLDEYLAHYKNIEGSKFCINEFPWNINKKNDNILCERSEKP